MFRKDHLDLVRIHPSDVSGPQSSAAGEYLAEGKVASPSGETYGMHDGYLDLLPGRTVADNIANFTNYLPGAGSGYEPLWRVRSLSLLTGDEFTNERELSIISNLVGIDGGGTFLDLGCSAGLYSRTFARRIGGAGGIVGIDIAPSMLKVAVRNSASDATPPSYARADAKHLPFADDSFSGSVCGGSLNEFGDPARVLRETSRVVKPGGRLAIMGILQASTRNGRRLQKFLSTGGIRFFEPQELSSMLSHSGFTPDPLQTFGPVFFAGATNTRY